MRLCIPQVCHDPRQSQNESSPLPNREQRPNFVEALRRPGWMKLCPSYQRRPRWDRERQSRLIESFIMNIPVPPLFVYESDLAKYEVMDGQQRITAIFEFYSNRYKLEGLQQWPELNGRIYDTLPSETRKGLDRCSIAYIVLLKESASQLKKRHCSGSRFSNA